MQNDIASKISRLPKPVSDLIFAASRAAGKSRSKIYLVGGIVRDLLLDRQSKDIDIMVEGDADRVISEMSHLLSCKPVIHKKFGTATFSIDDYRLDISTCRSETYDHPGALPRVSPGSIRDDLLRRDFTINAMAVSIIPGQIGDLIDICSGRHDLDRKLVRILHDRSFIDDATRIMRAIRYEQRLKFRLERHTLDLLRHNLDMLNSLSGDRLRHEVIRWLHEPQPWKILKRAHDLGILSKIHPALMWTPQLARAFLAVARSCGSCSQEKLFLNLLVYHMNGSQLEELLQRLNAGREFGEAARQTVSLKEKAHLLDDVNLKRSEIYRMLKEFKTVAIRANALCAPPGTARTNLKLYLNTLNNINSMIQGKDLIKMGIPENKKMGKILESLLSAKLDGVVKTRDDEIKLVQKLSAHL